MSIGIYQITEIATGLIYIGQSRRMEGRLKDHNKRFHPDTHTYEVLMECDADVLDFFERAFISGYDCLAPKGLNKTTGGGRAFDVSDETKQKISEANKEKKRTPEQIENYKLGAKKRSPPSQETKDKIANTLKGIPLSEERKQTLKTCIRKKAVYSIEGLERMRQACIESNKRRARNK